MTISCPGGEIHVSKALWGKSSPSDCPGIKSDTEAWHDRPTYDPRCKAEDVTRTVRRRCTYVDKDIGRKKNSSCTLPVHEGTFMNIDPCKGHMKMLQVFYQCVFPFPTSNTSYAEAKRVCEAKRMHLVEPRNAEENKELAKSLGYGRNPVFIGMTKGGKNEDWKWETWSRSSSRNVEYTSWYEQPDDQKGYFCAIMLTHWTRSEEPRWFNVPCHGKYGRKNQLDVACMLRESHVFSFPGKKTFQAAQSICRSHGLVLPEPRNEMENLELSTHHHEDHERNRHYHKINDMIFLGIQYSPRDSQWQYVSDKSKVTYTSWETDGWCNSFYEFPGQAQPHNMQTEHCVLQQDQDASYNVHKRGKRGGKDENWRNVNCHADQKAVRRVICQEQ